MFLKKSKNIAPALRKRLHVNQELKYRAIKQYLIEHCRNKEEEEDPLPGKSEGCLRGDEVFVWHLVGRTELYQSLGKEHF